jgi:hypothetical protein
MNKKNISIDDATPGQIWQFEDIIIQIISINENPYPACPDYDKYNVLVLAHNNPIRAYAGWKPVGNLDTLCPPDERIRKNWKCISG